jgi:glycosyltransferase involved in cell wall biosynthesis
MTTLWYLPEHEPVKNPYGLLLMRSLRERGIHVIPMLYRHLFALPALQGVPDVVHFQFVHPYIVAGERPDSVWRAVIKGTLFIAQVAFLRLLGSRIIYTVHDLNNHERRVSGVERFFTLLFTRLTHVLVTHGRAAAEAVIERYHLQRAPEKVAVTFHPVFSDAYPDVLSREQARRSLGIGDDVLMLLSIGQLRAYKGLPDVMREFRALQHEQPSELWIAGEAVDASLAEELRIAANMAPDVHLLPTFQSPEAVEQLCKACDVVVLPYRAILTSGAAILAMGFGRPCVAPRLGCLVDVLDADGAFLYDPADPRGLHDALQRALQSREQLEAMGAHNKRRVAGWSWPAAAEFFEGVYLCASSSSPTGRERVLVG